MNDLNITENVYYYVYLYIKEGICDYCTCEYFLVSLYKYRNQNSQLQYLFILHVSTLPILLPIVL